MTGVRKKAVEKNLKGRIDTANTGTELFLFLMDYERLYWSRYDL